MPPLCSASGRVWLGMLGEQAANSRITSLEGTISPLREGRGNHLARRDRALDRRRLDTNRCENRLGERRQRVDRRDVTAGCASRRIDARTTEVVTNASDAADHATF